MNARALIACGVAALAGCRELPPAPELAALQPPVAKPGLPHEATLTGSGFHLRATADLDDSSASSVAPAVTFSRGALAFAALEVVWRSAGELSLRVPPLTPGAWDVTLVDGWGRVAGLAGGLVVQECASDADCADGLSCTADACLDGACVHGAVEDGAACEDGDPCTEGDQCLGGACAAGQPRTCADVACQIVACNPASGACEGVPVDDGTRCDDGNACTMAIDTDACFAGACVGSCGPIPPVACLGVAPVAAHPGETVTFDATCTARASAIPLDGLSFRFDFDGDGVFDAPAQSGAQYQQSPVATARYASSGLWRAVVEVRANAVQLSEYAVRYVSVEDHADDVVVTTGADEDDPGASPEAGWGGEGCSLREAIAYANQASARRIHFAPGLTVTLSGQRPSLPAIAPQEMLLVGEDDVSIRFPTITGTSGPACLVLGGQRQRAVGLRAQGCAVNLLDLAGDEAGVLDSHFRGPGTQVPSAGVRARGPRNRIGPNVEVSGFGLEGVDVKAKEAVVDGVRSHQNGVGVRVSASSGGGARIERSLVYGNFGAGIEIGAGAQVRSCTVVGNGDDGIDVGTFSSGAAEVTNTLSVGNLGYGLAGPASMVALRTPNGYHANGLGHLSPSMGAPVPGSDVLQDPSHLRRGAGDFRLSQTSPAIGRAVPWPTGFDFNGPAPGAYNGSAPDLGGEESPW